MTDSIIMERVADAAAECFYAELVKAEDLGAFEALAAADARSIAAGVLRRCIERFDAGLADNMPRGWSVREHAARTLVTLVGETAFVRTVFRDELGRRRVLADELLGIPPRARISPRCFLWIAAHASELSLGKTAAGLAAYAASRASEIRPPAHGLGTIEGTNARIGAARLKGQGRSWSRRGAEAICLIRCALATGRPLVAPAASPRFTERQVEAAVSAMGKRGGRMPETSGRGWEPPHRAQPLGKSVMISLSQRS